MKLILDIDDELLSKMQGYCKQQNTNMSDMISFLFSEYIQKPAEYIDQIYNEKGNLSELEEFSELLTHYINEAIYDIEESSRSDEAYETDEIMIKAFKVINRDVVQDVRTLINIHKECSE